MTQDIPMVEVPTAILADVVQLIDTVTTRGAFQGAELGGVAQIRAFCVETVNTANEALAAPAVEEKGPPKKK